MLTFRSVLVLMLAVVALPSMALTLTGQADAVDGDTLDLAGHRVRLFGIDAPERAQTCDRDGQAWACGAWSRDALAGAVSSATVTCDVRGADRYGRALAICHIGPDDLAYLLVRSGAATAYRRYSSRYTQVEAQAADARAGIWSSRMIAPEAFRHADNSDPGNCRIKGNISAGGRIYHSPGQRDYDTTRINPAKGEAYFCSATAAQAAGFRPAAR